MIVRFLFALSLASAAVPAAAQEPLTEAQLVDCAVFTAAVVGSSSDLQVQAGAGFFMTWLVGLYEGRTGKDIDEAMKLRSVSQSAADREKLRPFCSARMSAFGQRMSKLGAEISALGR